MRRYLKFLLLLIVLMLGLWLYTNVPATTFSSSQKSSQPPEESRVELYQDIFLTLLLPSVQNEVDKYYSKYLTQTPMVAPYTITVLSAERPNGYRTFFFRLKLQVISYIGPHNSVGLDDITATIDGSGNVKIEEFEHLKSFMLPPTYVDIIKNGYKNPIP